MKTNAYKRLCKPFGAALMLGPVGSAMCQPVLPDWTSVTFDAASASLTNGYFPHPEGLVSVYEGFEGDAFERIETFSTFHTKSILGVEARVIRDKSYEDGLLVEIANDWYAQDTDGTVWYFGESVINYRYDEDGNLIGTDDEGSWIADGVVNFPGVIMWADPMVGMEYYQEYAPDVALDFALVNSLDDTVDIPFGHFTEVLNTSEGNLIDGPELVENKLYAPGIGLALIQVLDDEGDPEFEVPLIEQYVIPAPGAAALLGLAVLRARPRGRR